MIRMTFRWALWVAPLLLAGCLLPQPDTPIIPPGVQPVSAPETDNGRTGIAGIGLLSGHVEGTGVTAITAVPVEGRGTQVRQQLGESGNFDLTLSPGDYQLELTVDGVAVKAPEKLTVQIGDTRTFVVTVKKDPASASVAETTVKEDATATPETPATP
jgi:hypothetical protein